MKLIQSLDNKNIYFVNHNGCRIVINFLKGGEALKCSIMINDLILGKYDLLSNTSLVKAYNNYTAKYERHYDRFADETDFTDLFLRAGQKIRDSEYDREATKDKHKLTKEAKKFLQAPNLLDKMDWIERRTTEDPLIYCEDDLLLFNLVIVSCKTSRPITYEHTGPASCGKTFPAQHAINGYPFEMIMDPASVTSKAMKYDYDYQDQETGNFINKTGEKCICFMEKEDNLDAVKFFKPMMSHDKEKLEHKVTGKNAITNQPEAVTYILDGIASFILLSVGHMDDEEMSSRTLKGSPTVSKEKTEKIIRDTFKSDTLHRLWKPPKELDVMHDSMYSLGKAHTINPFASILADIFPKDDMRRARDMNRLRGLVQACTVLHQFQRCYEIIDDKKVYYTTFEDNLIALILIDRLLEATVMGIPATTFDVFEIMKDMTERDIPLTFNNIHEQAETSGIRMTMDTLKKTHVETLSNHRLIKRKQQATRSRERSYGINNEYEKLYKVPKLTPAFIEEAQRLYTEIIRTHKDYLQDIQLPETPIPDNTVTGKNSNNIDKAVKYLFGLNYFKEKSKNNVLWKITENKIRDLLFDDIHILKQERIKLTERKKIIREKNKATKDLKSGKAAQKWLREINNSDEKEWEKYLKEQRNKEKEMLKNDKSAV